MQTLLAFLPLAQTAPTKNPVSAILEQLGNAQVDWGKFVLALVLGQIVAIIAILIASKAVVPDRYRTGFSNALRVWFFSWGLSILMFVVTVVIALALYAAGVSQFFWIALLVIMLVSLVLLIRIPMGTYEIRFFRSIGLLIIAWVVSAIGQFAVNIFVGPSPQELASLQQAWTQTLQYQQRIRQAGTAAGQMLPGEKEARDTSKSLPERGEALKTMYAELEKRRQAITPGDTKATAAYESNKARYEKLLDQLKAEAEKQSPGGSQ